MNALKVPSLRFPEFSGEWLSYTLNIICNLIDCEHKTAPYVDSSDYLVVRTNNVKDGSLNYKDIRFTTELGYEAWTKRGKPQYGDVVFTREAPAGEVCLVPLDKKVCLGQRLVLLKPLEDYCSGKFLVLFFQSSFGYDEISKFVIGTTVTRINIVDIYKIICLLPSLPEQTKIAAFLSSVDSKIDQLSQKKTLLEQYKKGVMQQLFSQQIRFKADDGSDYPEWEEKKLGEVGRVAMCKRILKDQTLPFGDIPFYKIGTFGKEPDAFISTDLYEEYKSKYSHPKVGDVLISASGTIGRTVVYDGLPAYFQDSNIVWIDNDEQIVKNSFLYFFYETVVWNTEDTTIARLYNDNLKSIRIEIPCLEEQTKIANFLSAIDSKIEQIVQQLEAAKQFKKGLLQQMFV